MREEIIKAAKVLESGGVILYPTDTLWGIGCDATSTKSVQKVYKIKRRKKSMSFIVLLDQPEKLINYVKFIPDITWDLLNRVDTPLTVVYPNAKNLAKNVLASDGSVAIRIVKDLFCRRLINLFNKPIVSTSANFTREPAPLIYNNISREIIERVDLAVNVHRDRLHDIRPSTIIKVDENGDYIVLR